MSPHRGRLPDPENHTERNKTKRRREADSQRWVGGWMDGQTERRKEERKRERKEGEKVRNGIE